MEEVEVKMVEVQMTKVVDNNLVVDNTKVVDNNNMTNNTKVGEPRADLKGQKRLRRYSCSGL